MTLNLAERPATPNDMTTSGQFSLAGLMLFITWIGMCLAALAASIGSLFPIIFVMIPALMRTIAAAKRRRHEGNSRSGWALVVQYLASMAIMAGCIFGAVMGLFVVEVIALRWKGMDDLKVMLSITAGITAYIALAWVTWPWRGDERRGNS